MKLTATKQSNGDGIRVDKHDRTGRMLSFYVGKFVRHTDFKMASNRLGVEEDKLLRIVTAAQADGAGAITVDLTPAPPIPSITIRGELTGEELTIDGPDIDLALQTAKPGRYIEWENDYWLCCLDIDFHEHYKPDIDKLLSLCQSINPLASHIWETKNGGVHLIYSAIGLYSADEFAATAAYQIATRYPNATIEFLKRTRVPPKGYASVICNKQTTEVDSLRALLNMPIADENARIWLESRNLTPGERYPHSECPVSPSKRAKRNTPPVVVYDDHIYCYVCAADGKIYGSRTPGYFPISALTGNRISTMISACVKNFVHYGHARYVMQSNDIFGEQLGKRIYSALLKLQYGDDSRIPLVFNAGEPNGLVRYSGHWADKGGSILAINRGSAIIQSIPHCLTLLPNGSLSVDRESADWLCQPIDHSIRGYIPVSPIYGIMLTQFQPRPTNVVHTVLQTANLSSEEMANRRPKYVPQSHRMDEDSAWKVLTDTLPGFDRRLVECLIVARGCSEMHSGLPPMVAIVGPTGSGKTSHIHVASAICGDGTVTVPYNKDKDRFNNELMNAKRRSGMVLFDEYFKHSKAAGVDCVTAMENLLGFTPDSMVYMIHIGAVPLGELPVFIWADTEIPPQIETHEQIGRRVHRYELARELSWERPLSDSGIKEPRFLRQYGSIGIVNACNCILSCIIDRWFTTVDATDFASVCKELGVKKIRDSEAIEAKYRTIRELYECWTNTPEISGPDKRRVGGDYRIVRENGVDELSRLWESAKEINIQELDLSRILDGKASRMIYRKHGARHYLKFILEG